MTLIIINVHAEQKATCRFSGFDRRLSRMLLCRRLVAAIRFAGRDAFFLLLRQ
ncbi:MAG: hypothetical protein OSB39_10255 [Opitutales bacterium]|nr:hypothetical protein [Opitutales bacterium]